MDNRIYIYTDGACKGNPGPGGWGALLKYKEHKKEMFFKKLFLFNFYLLCFICKYSFIFIFKKNISNQNKNNSNSLFKSVNLIMANGVPFELFFSCIDIIVPATLQLKSSLFINKK